jgi:hypothetical protein
MKVSPFKSNSGESDDRPFMIGGFHPPCRGDSQSNFARGTPAPIVYAAKSGTKSAPSDVAESRTPGNISNEALGLLAHRAQVLQRPPVRQIRALAALSSSAAAHEPQPTFLTQTDFSKQFCEPLAVQFRVANRRRYRPVPQIPLDNPDVRPLVHQSVTATVATSL